VNNEIVHIVDLYTTIARVGGSEVPKDRPVDGVWRNWKAHLIWQENMYAPPQKLPLPKIINLLTDLKEERDVGAQHSWVADPVVKIIGELEGSLKRHPPIKVGTPDPYRPTP
jgi:arylsulfatase